MAQLSAKEIIAAAAERGVFLTARQLGSWRSLGIAPTGDQHGIARAKGTVWTYPPETVDLSR